jgi:hypothetical protein
MMPAGNTSTLTLQGFLDGLTMESPDQSSLALRAKAAILFERAHHLAQRWDPGEFSSRDFYITG